MNRLPTIHMKCQDLFYLKFMYFKMLSAAVMIGVVRVIHTSLSADVHLTRKATAHISLHCHKRSLASNTLANTSISKEHIIFMISPFSHSIIQTNLPSNEQSEQVQQEKVKRQRIHMISFAREGPLFRCSMAKSDWCFHYSLIYRIAYTA